MSTFKKLDLLQHDACDAIIQQAARHLTRAMVGTPKARRVHSSRFAFNHRFDKPIDELYPLIDTMVGLSGCHESDIEPVEVVMYPHGGLYDWHTDGSHRTHTMIVALSDTHTGGELCVDNKEIVIPKGHAVWWDNAPFVRHRANPVTRGVKWVAVLWARNSPKTENTEG